MQSATVRLGASLLILLTTIAGAGEEKKKVQLAEPPLTDLKQEPRFSDHPAVPVYRGKVTPPRFRKSSQPGDLDFPDGDPHCGWDRDGFYDQFYGRMKPNFAGHYILTGCTCGSGCHYLLMWDARNGEVIRNLPVGTIDVGPYFQTTPPIEYAGEKHRVDSALLVLEGCFDEDAHPELRDCGRYFYLWSGTKFVLLLKQPTRVPPLR